MNDQLPTNEPRRRLGTRDGVFQKKGWWWIDFRDADGRRHRKKAAPDYNTAKTIYRDTMTKIAKGEITGLHEEGVNVRDFVKVRYWPATAPRLSRWERPRVRSILDQQILPTFGTLPLVKVRPDAIEAWRAGRLAEVSLSTVNKEVTYVKHLFNRAVEWGYLRVSPAAKIKKTSESHSRVRFLTPAERALLLNGREETVIASDGRTWTIRRAPDPSLLCYIVAALQTGARRSELLNLRWGDVDLRAELLTFRGTKNGDDRTIPISATLRDVLRALPRSLDPAASVFPQRSPQALTRAFGYLVRRLGIKDLRFHDLRHDAASTLTMAGVSQRAIMAMLGHRRPEMSMRYQHVDVAYLREAARALDTRPHERSGTITAPTGERAV